MSEPTVVSTTPSGTEICYAVGVEPAAVSHACDFPPAARDRPVVTMSRGTGSGPSRYDIDVERLRKIDPDLIVTQSVCGTCAVDEALVRAELDGGADVDVVSLNAASLADVYDCIRTVGAAVGREERAESVVGQLRDCVEQIDSMTRERGPRPTVVVLEWLDPLRAAGNWVPDLVAAAGGEYPLADPGERSTELPWAELRKTDPEVLILAPCSLDPAATLDRLDELVDRPGWDELGAVVTGQVYAFEGNILSRWTPRLGGALERLAGVCHPPLVDGRPDARAVVQGR